MRNLLLALSLIICSSCTFYEPQFKGGESIQFGQLKGKEIQFTAAANVYNPNGYTLKVKPSELDLYVEGEYMGKVHLDKKVKMKRKKETRVEAPFTATLADGALFRMMRFVNKSEIEVKLSGKVKAGVWFVSKKIDVEETRTIKGGSIKL